MRWYPKHYTLLAADIGLGIEVFGDARSAMAFHGKAQKSDWHHGFGSIAARDAKIADYVKAHYDHVARKLAAAAAKKAWRHTVKIGDVLRCSWGYDQTNVDYYQVTALVGTKMVEVRPIGVESIEDGNLTGLCVPLVGGFCGAAARYVVQPGNHIRIASYANAYLQIPLPLTGGYEPAHWTAYA